MNLLTATLKQLGLNTSGSGYPWEDPTRHTPGELAQMWRVTRNTATSRIKAGIAAGSMEAAGTKKVMDTTGRILTVKCYRFIDPPIKSKPRRNVGKRTRPACAGQHLGGAT